MTYEPTPEQIEAAMAAWHEHGNFRERIRAALIAAEGAACRPIAETEALRDVAIGLAEALKTELDFHGGYSKSVEALVELMGRLKEGKS